ncbi:sulfotransferase domain-containing protein [Halalkalibacter urbisdiaboli]|uniref:sulfotransferase domain-containing protein n=1 Tax=Halalkalibacter urbisdiaboli TaxID=1960589 RepID=UPI000B43E72A|nr:sulfotransferase domain-containing protein [Halalkalibacter urbisdiaboli]
MELPKVLINSVPKSGTNLLVQIINGIPGMFNEQYEFYYKGNREKVLNLRNGEFVTSHIDYDETFSKKLEEKNIKHVFIYRDLRDIIVSMRYFILGKLPSHPLRSTFNSHLLTQEEQLEALIQGTQFVNEEIQKQDSFNPHPGLYQEFKMIYEWVHAPGACVVRYEDFIKSKETKTAALNKIINYLWDDLKQIGMTKEELYTSIEKNINPKKAWTYRKGEIGNWKQEFSQKNKESFKQVAGDFLIKLGYEEHLNW